MKQPSSSNSNQMKSHSNHNCHLRCEEPILYGHLSLLRVRSAQNQKMTLFLPQRSNSSHNRNSRLRNRRRDYDGNDQEVMDSTSSKRLKHSVGVEVESQTHQGYNSSRMETEISNTRRRYSSQKNERRLSISSSNSRICKRGEIDQEEILINTEMKINCSNSKAINILS